MQKLQKGFITPALIITVVVLIAGGLLGAFYFGKKSSAPTSNSAISSPTLDATVYTDEGSANWKTYTGKTFTFKYPKGWNVIDDGSSESTFHLRLQKDINAREAYESLTISSDDSVTDGAKTSTYLQSNERKFTKKTNDISFITFDDNSKQVYSTCRYLSSEVFIETCNQILSTFKFTN